MNLPKPFVKRKGNGSSKKSYEEHVEIKKTSANCVDMEELMQFEAARQRALNQQPPDAEIDLFVDFVPKRIFINQVDTFNGSHLAKFINSIRKELPREEGDDMLDLEEYKSDDFLSQEDEDEMYNGNVKKLPTENVAGGAYEILGTLEFTNHQEYKRPEGILELLDNEKKHDFLKKILTCGYIVYDISSDLYCHPKQIQEAKWVVEVIYKQLEEMETHNPRAFLKYKDCRTFILISSLMTWAKTKPLDPENPSLPFTEKNYRKRKPHSNYKAHFELEKRVIELGKKYPKNLRTIVVGSGIPYGHEEDVLHFLFKMAWQDAPHLPIFKNGNGLIPVIHIDSLASIIYSIIESFPAKYKYIIAADPQLVTLKEIVKLLAQHLGNGNTELVSEAEAFLYPEVKQREYDMLTAKINIEPGFVMDNPLIRWGSDSPFTENLPKLITEFKIARGLLPIKIFIHGPPASGKTFLAERLAQYYDIPRLSVKNVIDEYIQKLKSKIDEIKKRAARAEHRNEESMVIDGDETVEEEEDNEFGDEDQKNLESLQQTLMEIETNMENNEGNRLDDEYVIRFFKEKLQSNLCMNKGYIIDGYPKTMELTKMLYEPAEEGEVLGENEEEEGQEEDLSRLCNMKILPVYVESLDASDDFLINRVIKLPAKGMTQFEEHEMCRRLTEFRALNTEDNTPLIFYDELDVHPMIYNVENDLHPQMEPTFQAIIDHVGPPKNYGPIMPVHEKQKEERERIASENLKAQKEELKKAVEERREKMQKWMMQKNQELEMEEKALLVLGMPLRHYLMKYIFPCLTRGLVEVARVRPDDPIDFLSEFLFRENPEGKMFQPDYDERQEKLSQALKEYEASCARPPSLGSGRSSRNKQTSHSTEKSIRSGAVSKVSDYKCSLVTSKSSSGGKTKTSTSGIGTPTTTPTKHSSAKTVKSSSITTVSDGVCTCQKSPSLSTCSSDRTPSQSASTATSCKCGNDSSESCEPCTPEDKQRQTGDDVCKCPCT